MTIHTVHFTLTNKGGVGKSLITSLLAQHLRSKGDIVHCIDSGSMNATFSGYADLNVKHVALMKGKIIDERTLDKVIEEIVKTEATYIIDIGSPAFIAVSRYLIEYSVFDLLQKHNRKSAIHTVITGSKALNDTLSSFDALATQLPLNADLVIWENSYFGEILLNGKPFQQSKLYATHKERILAILKLPSQIGTFTDDMTNMLQKQMTFDEVAHTDTFSLITKSRLHRIKQEIFNEISKAF